MPVCPGTESNGKEPRIDPQAATDGGEGAASPSPQQLQAGMELESADVAEPLPPPQPTQQQQQQEVQPTPCDGVGDAGPLGAVGPGTGRVGGGGVEEERLAPGAERERPACPEGK